MPQSEDTLEEVARLLLAPHGDVRRADPRTGRTARFLVAARTVYRSIGGGFGLFSVPAR